MAFHDASPARAADAYPDTPAGALVVRVYEALALGMIEAAQRSHMVGLLDTAAALLDVEELGDVLQATQSLAMALGRQGLFVHAPRRDEPCGFDLCPRRQLH